MSFMAALRPGRLCETGTKTRSSQGSNDPVGPGIDIFLIARIASFNAQAISHENGTKCIEFPADHIHRTAKMLEAAVTACKTCGFLSLDIDRIELFEQRVEIALEFDFVSAPGGTAEQNSVITGAKTFCHSISSIQDLDRMSSGTDPFTHGFGKAFRIARFGTINDKYIHQLNSSVKCTFRPQPNGDAPASPVLDHAGIK